MKHSVQHFLKEEGGASAVEFALVLPVLVSMIFGIICFGQYFAIASSLQQLAAEAARQSVVGIGWADRQARALSFIDEAETRFSFLGQDKISDTTVTPIPQENPDGIEVSVTYDLTGSAVELAGSFIGMDMTTLTRRSYLAY